MDEFIHELKIPKARIAVLIGTKGETKRELEEETKTKIEIDSKEGEVRIKGTDTIKLYSVKEMITAIGRGFNPEIAKLMLKPDYYLEIISLQDYTDKHNRLIQIRGRVIGTKGKSRTTIEILTDTKISVYGKTISVIGEASKVFLAKKAIENLLEGSNHSTVYKWLERSKAKLKEQEFLGI
ncbi:MAG: KH domain-containing protein [Nanoarchaeota archaeon]|nr:KH domain-containing protein [Nanoarchaeota archaeon]MBU1031267.1 KH domain-containing protein [Nanoarchaeota archaeon]MBU1850489.1 KH domain-containing protein [Nanoarchaeota archaeon]